MINRFRSTRALLSTGVLLSMVWAGTFAIWSDSSGSTATFSTGDIDIESSPATVVFTSGEMAPGDSVYGGITVNNAGSLPLKYRMTTAAAGALGTALIAEVRTVSGTCDAASFSAGSVIASPSSLSALAISTWRTLDSGASEVACFNVKLPLTDTGSQGLTTSATFTFSAEQTANN